MNTELIPAAVPLVRSARRMTPASVWQAAAARPIAENLLEWPPDLFALTSVLIERSDPVRPARS